MRIRIDKIPEHGILLAFEKNPKTFPVLGKIAKDGGCEFISPISFRLRAIRVHELVEVEGKFKTTVRLSCSRCLEDFETSLQSRIFLCYTQERPEVFGAANEEDIEITAQDIGLILFHGKEIDLTKGIQEHLVMSIPFKPLCSETCKGFCPGCGMDLNESECRCDRSSIHNAFATLKDFKIPNPDKPEPNND